MEQNPRHSKEELVPRYMGEAAYNFMRAYTKNERELILSGNLTEELTERRDFSPQVFQKTILTLRISEREGLELFSEWVIAGVDYLNEEARACRTTAQRMTPVY